ncbi:Hypothetical protein ETEE_3576 [Edwardsiella anguillarum ET080813]|uniref:Uncharacterized protein n=1 Tax=Edwardsiella anguillarum ET080813 TaxID=667120 RepID=A0A076LPZ0_9GAMM|nr:Hypothetical protein ETEE_3576 [Edwardsiella anguillarum ET080813]
MLQPRDNQGDAKIASARFYAHSEIHHNNQLYPRTRPL